MVYTCERETDREKERGREREREREREGGWSEGAHARVLDKVA